MKILAVSGSLRANSSNAAVLRAAAAVGAAGVEVALYEGVGGLQHFDPDLDREGATPPPPVADWRARLAAADSVLICSPEYAHAVPGALENALDWLVSVPELIGKPVAVWSVAPSGGEFAQAQLVETLRVMSWQVLDAACVQVALGRAQLDARGEERARADGECLHVRPSSASYWAGPRSPGRRFGGSRGPRRARTCARAGGITSPDTFERARFTSTASTQGARFLSCSATTWPPLTRPTDTPSSPARIRRISGSPQSRPFTRTARKRS